jgi:hypothetical protein
MRIKQRLQGRNGRDRKEKNIERRKETLNGR